MSGVIVGLKTTERGMNIAPPIAGPSTANTATIPIIGIKKGRAGSLIARLWRIEDLREFGEMGVASQQIGAVSIAVA